MALPSWLLVSMGGRCSQCLGPSPILGSLGPFHHWRHKSRVSLWGPPCAHGVLGTLHEEVRYKVDLQYKEWLNAYSLSLQKALDTLLFVSQSRPLHPPSDALHNIGSCPLKGATLRVETLLLSCTKAWCFCSWDNGDMQLQTILQIAPHVLWNQGHKMHKKFHDVLNYTMHTEMLMLEEWWWTKANTLTLTTLTFTILETLNPFHFLVSHLCNWLLGLLLWSLHHFDLNQLTMGAKVVFVYHVLSFVRNCRLPKIWT